MHVSLSHGEKFSRVHSPAALWVHSVNTHGFEACAREAGDGSNGTGWFSKINHKLHLVA